MRMAAKAPVATCWLTAGEEDEAAVADADAEEPPEPPEPDVAAEPELEAAELMEVVMVAPARDSLAETRAAVAFLVPQTSA
jgi:hypothetical protein